MSEFQTTFTENKTGITTLVEHRIPLTTTTPVRSRPYAIPYSFRESLKMDVEEMLDIGIIERTDSPYASPLVVVQKRDGTNSVCVDYRKLNKCSLFDPEPTPVAVDIFALLSKAKYLSTLDLSKGYWQIPVAVEDIPKIGFVTPDGIYAFKLMPFGLLINPAATFNRMMRNLLCEMEKSH